MGLQFYLQACGHRNAWTCAPRNSDKNIHGSILHNSLKLETTQISLKNKLVKIVVYLSVAYNMVLKMSKLNQSDFRSSKGNEWFSFIFFNNFCGLCQEHAPGSPDFCGNKTVRFHSACAVHCIQNAISLLFPFLTVYIPISKIISVRTLRIPSKIPYKY